ncbi:MULTISPECIES: hypothetical protein [unclassified Streptomyces]|uniref:hypothetical protein n=1 Tax=unclassified Streptomyces TaxID=2593676 RepID=UPI0036533433
MTDTDPMTSARRDAALNTHYTDPRVRLLAESRWRMQTDGTRMNWLCLGKDNPEALISEGRDWIRAAVAAGILAPHGQEEAAALPAGFTAHTCVTVTCAACGYFHDEDEGVHHHFTSLADALSILSSFDWVVLADGRALCPAGGSDHDELKAATGEAESLQEAIRAAAHEAGPLAGAPITDEQRARALADLPPGTVITASALRAVMPRRFVLLRHTDVSGVSGTGIVADGIRWADGTASLRWRGDRPSTVHWDQLADAEAVHGHGGATEIVWVDVPADRANGDADGSSR